MTAEPFGRVAGDGRSPSRVPGTALVRIPDAAPQPRRRRTRAVLWALGMVGALGLGAAGIRTVQAGGTAAVTTAQADTAAQALQRLQDEVARLQGSIDALKASTEAARQDEPMRGLRRSVDGLKQEIDQVKASSATSLAQLSTRVEKADHDPAPKLAEIMARLDKFDRDPPKAPDGTTQKLAEQKLADVQNRLERVEKQVSEPTTTGSIPPAVKPMSPTLVPIPVPAPVASAAVKQVSAKPDLAPHPAANPTSSVTQAARSVAPKTDPAASKSATYVLREVYDGLALVEARGGDLREVAPGEYLPGMGEVRSIERHGRNWVVLTSRGSIENGTW